MRRARYLLLAPFFFGSVAVSSCSKNPPLNDNDIVRAMKAHYAFGDERPRLLGKRNGANVIISFYCQDSCTSEEDLKKIVHFDVRTFDSCQAAGGHMVSEFLPGVIEIDKYFCEPILGIGSISHTSVYGVSK